MSAPTETVWFCARLQRIEDNEGYCHANRYGPVANEHAEEDEGCGPRLLVDPSALVLLRDEEGQFLNFDSLLDVLEDMMHTRLIRYGIHERGRCASLAAMAVEVFADRLDALAAASKEGKT